MQAYLNYIAHSWKVISSWRPKIPQRGLAASAVAAARRRRFLQVDAGYLVSFR